MSRLDNFFKKVLSTKEGREAMFKVTDRGAFFYANLGTLILIVAFCITIYYINEAGGSYLQFVNDTFSILMPIMFAVLAAYVLFFAVNPDLRRSKETERFISDFISEEKDNLKEMILSGEYGDIGIVNEALRSQDVRRTFAIGITTFIIAFIFAMIGFFLSSIPSSSLHWYHYVVYSVVIFPSLSAISVTLAHIVKNIVQY